MEPEEPLELFFDRALHLKEKLKVVLWQFPPGFRIEFERLEHFLALLNSYPVRSTLEFRNESWITDKVINLCREHNTGFCMADWPEFIDDLPGTSDFVYMRRHGREGNYASRYSKTELKKDARRVRDFIKDGKDVFLYFNNDAHGFAPANAQELTGMMKEKNQEAAKILNK